MEKLEESSKKPIEKDAEKTSNNPPPWIELLDSLIELIMEKLPLVDYIRFGTVCKQWYSIQKGHRLCHSPKPPPMAASLVLVNFIYYCNEYTWETQLFCHYPFEAEKKFGLSLPYLTSVRILDSCSGWILICDRLNGSLDKFNIHNPVTGVMIQLPQFACSDEILNGSMSAPPTDLNCCIIVTTSVEVFVHRLGELSWKKVQVTVTFPFAGSNYVYVNGMFYRISITDQKYYIYNVDPFHVEPIEHYLEIDNEEIVIGKNSNFHEKYENLVAIDGELYLVLVWYLPTDIEHIKKDFLLFKANFSTKKWIRVTRIGDYAILLSDNAKSLLVDSVQGFKKNMIYFTHHFSVNFRSVDDCVPKYRIAWMTFDMDSKQVVEGPSFLHDKERNYDENKYGVFKTCMLFWFTPTL